MKQKIKGSLDKGEKNKHTWTNIINLIKFKKLTTCETLDSSSIKKFFMSQFKKPIKAKKKKKRIGN